MQIDTSVPHPARVYNYWLGGKDHYEADRALAEAMVAEQPAIPLMTQENRRFLERAVRHLVTDLGIRQFLDIGSGIPTARNTHEVAQEIDPAARVVYVDNDPIVLAHSRALLTSTPQGRTAFVAADARDTAAVLGDPALAATLDLDRPVALMLVSFLMYFDDATVAAIVDPVLDALPPGSHIVVSHPSGDFDPESFGRAVAVAARAGMHLQSRSDTDVARLLRRAELLEPGVVPMLTWRPDRIVRDPHSVYYWAAMARLP